MARLANFPAGAVVFRQGEPATTVYWLLEGNVTLEICAPGSGCKRILTVAPGELLGWSPLLEQQRLTATAREGKTPPADMVGGTITIRLRTVSTARRRSGAR